MEHCGQVQKTASQKDGDGRVRCPGVTVTDRYGVTRVSCTALQILQVNCLSFYRLQQLIPVDTATKILEFCGGSPLFRSRIPKKNTSRLSIRKP